MFVDIEKADSVLKLSGELMKYVNGKEKISPEVCMDVLKRTNHGGVVKKMLNCVAKLPEDEQAGFKEVVFSVFDKREQPQSVEKIGRELAESGGYSGELRQVIDEVKNSEGWVKVLASSSQREYMAVLLDSDLDFDIKHIIIKFLDQCSDCSKLKFASKCGKFRGISDDEHKEKFNSFDFADCERVYMLDYDVSCVKNFKFAKGSDVHFIWCKRLYDGVDFSGCDKVTFDKMELDNFNTFKFRENGNLCIKRCSNFPEVLDLTAFDKVSFEDCNFEKVNSIKFTIGTEIMLNKCNDVAEIVDLSNFRKVYYEGTEGDEILDVKFMRNSEITLRGCKNISQNVDFSECEKVLLDDCSAPKNMDFSNSDSVCFTDVDMANCESMRFHKYTTTLLTCRNVRDDLVVYNNPKVLINGKNYNNVEEVEEETLGVLKNALKKDNSR